MTLGWKGTCHIAWHKSAFFDFVHPRLPFRCLHSSDSVLGYWMPLTEATFDWLVSLELEDTFELLLWIGLIIRSKLLGFRICFRDFVHYLNRLTTPVGAPPQHVLRRVRRRIQPANPALHLQLLHLQYLPSVQAPPVSLNFEHFTVPIPWRW